MKASKPMTFSIFMPPYDRWKSVDEIGEAARLADSLGFDMSFGEHIVRPVAAGVPTGPVVYYDIFVLASHLATLTKRARLIFNVLVVPYRPPVLAAKLISTLDVISKGRLVVGTGVGWARGEFAALGVPFEERGAITDEYLRAMKVLWTEENPTFAGKYVAFSDIVFAPKCVQKPHVPLWIGGGGRAPLRRTVELGDGWSPSDTSKNADSLDSLARDILWIKEHAEATGRDPAALDFAFWIDIGPLDPAWPGRARSSPSEHPSRPIQKAPVQTVEDARGLVLAYRKAGFNHFHLRFDWREAADMMRGMEWFASKVLPAVAE